jgi:hypothetical protein
MLSASQSRREHRLRRALLEHPQESFPMKMHLNRMSPGITDMIRMDHTHVFAAFHRFKHSTSHARKSALVRNACLAIDVHAQLEEEIFYPELRDSAGADPVLDRSGPEHNETRCAR